MSILIYKQRHRHPNRKKTPKRNYTRIGCTATRPGVTKNRGMCYDLFGKLEPDEVQEFVTWQKTVRLVRELSYRRVDMYRGIVSFSPGTAAGLGLTDREIWKDYMERHILTLIKYNGIRVQNLQWVAIHHNEQGHLYIHVVFWDKGRYTMVLFVHPSIPNKIYRQLIRNTFAEKTQVYCETKQQARKRLTTTAVDLVDELEQYMERLHPTEYKQSREASGYITDDELGAAPLDGVLDVNGMARLIPGLFVLKEKMSKKGRLAYKLLPEEVKAELNALIDNSRTDYKYVGGLVNEYADVKYQLSIPYDADPAYVKEQRQKGIAETDRLIANKILEAIRTMLRKDWETEVFEYARARKACYTERSICEILMALEQNATDMGIEYDDHQKTMRGDLSKATKKD